MGRGALPPGGGDGGGGRVCAAGPIRRRGRPPRARQRDRQGGDLGPGGAGRRRRDRAARLTGRRRSLVRAHRRLGGAPARAAARGVGDDVRSFRQATPRHGVAASGHTRRPPGATAPAETPGRPGHAAARGGYDAQDASVLRREGLPPGRGLLRGRARSRDRAARRARSRTQGWQQARAGRRAAARARSTSAASRARQRS